MSLRFRTLALLMLGLSLAICTPAYAGKKAKGEPRPAPNELIAKPPNTVVQLPRMRLAVPQDDNQTYRMLELEVWLEMDKPEDAAKLGAMKGRITDTMKDQFMGYKWEAFRNPDEGFALAKAVVKASVDQVTGGQPQVQDVLIRSMIMR